MEVSEHVFGMVACVKLVVHVKLLPTPRQAAALAATLHTCNEAAGFVSRMAFERNVKSRNELQKLCYQAVKCEFGLSAQPRCEWSRRSSPPCPSLSGPVARATSST